jgi:hypothetical protein
MRQCGLPGLIVDLPALPFRYVHQGSRVYGMLAAMDGHGRVTVPEWNPRFVVGLIYHVSSFILLETNEMRQPGGYCHAGSTTPRHQLKIQDSGIHLPGTGATDYAFYFFYLNQFQRALEAVLHRA